MAGDHPGSIVQEAPQHLATVGCRQRKVQPQVQAAIAEMAVRDPGQPVLPEQLLQFPQVRAERCGRDSRILPAGIGGRTARRAPGEPRAVLPDPPQRAGVPGIRDDNAVQGAGVRQHAGSAGRRVGYGVRGELDE